MKIIAILCALILLACAVTMHPLVFAIGCPIAAIGIIFMLYSNYKETVAVREKLEELSETIEEQKKALHIGKNAEAAADEKGETQTET